MLVREGHDRTIELINSFFWVHIDQLSLGNAMIKFYLILVQCFYSCVHSAMRT